MRCSSRVLLTSLIGLNCLAMHAATLVNPGFEAFEPTSGAFPSSFGDWTGDVSQIVTAQDGITPAEGVRMLQFLDASKSGPTITRTSSNMWQLVDVSSIAVEIAAGEVMVEASALFNRVMGDAETDTEFYIEIDALAGVPADFTATKIAETELAIGESQVVTDGDLATWEGVTASLLLPTQTDYLAIGIRAFENVVNDGTAPEFDGHYADDVSLTFHTVPEPSTMTLLAIALIAKLTLRRPKTS